MFKKFQKSVVEYWTFSLPALGAISYHRDGNGSSTCLKNTLWLFQDPPFFSSVNHLFRLGPWLNHGELLVITRGFFQFGFGTSEIGNSQQVARSHLQGHINNYFSLPSESLAYPLLRGIHTFWRLYTTLYYQQKHDLWLSLNLSHFPSYNWFKPPIKITKN